MTEERLEKPTRLGWRALVVLGAIVALNALIFVVVLGLSSEPAYAQSDGKDSNAPIDFYPEPFQDGAMAYSLRDPWPKTDLTYYFHNCPTRLECNVGRDAVRQAFQSWVEVSVLTFVEVYDVAQADIEVTWTLSDPEGVLGEPGGVLAYNYFPRYGGDMFIDDAEPWTVGDSGEFDLILTAIHEIGHGIGLAHSEYQDAIMYAYAGYATAIGPDDIQAIQELYGAPDSTPPVVDVEPERDIPAVEDTVDTVDGLIDNANPYDVWDLEVQDGVTVTLTMTRRSGDLDPYIGILSEDESEVLIENDNWLGNDARVVYVFDVGGTFKVVATRFGLERGSTTGSYTLTAEFSRSGTSPPPDNVPTTPQTVTFQITNFAETELCEIYFTPSSDDYWRENKAGGQSLADSASRQWEVQPETYDVQVWDCFGNSLEYYNINADRSVEVQVYWNRIAVVPLGTTVDQAMTTFRWRVSNYAGVNLCAIYFSPTTDDMWGDNRVADEPLQPDFYYEWQLEPGVYDVRVEDCSGGYLQYGQIPVNGDVEIAVYQDRIEPKILQ